MNLNSTVAISTGLIWVIAQILTAFGLTQSGLLGASLATIVGLMTLGGLLLVAVFAFVRYYTAEPIRLM